MSIKLRKHSQLSTLKDIIGSLEAIITERMGGYRSVPELTKLSIFQKKENTTYAVKEMCGWRQFMEDTFIAEDELPKNNACSLFAVFDGHGGPEVAIFAARHFSEELQKHELFRKFQYARCLTDTFFKMDALMQSQEGRKELLNIRREQFDRGNAQEAKDIDSSGCTALVCLITSNYVYIANAGDSRAIASIKGELKVLSEDHRPTSKKQTERITQAGGWVESGRIKGDLMVSRGFGDFPFKKNKYQKLENQMVTADPEIVQIQKKDIDYILLGCDGIWEDKSSQQMKDSIDEKLKQNPMDKTLEVLFDELVSKSKEGPKGMDNMTAIIIKLNQA